jgi:hypothetical protein
LDAHQVTWKCYNLGHGLGSTGSLEHFNGLTFFKKWQNDQRLTFTEDDYNADLKAGTFLIFLLPEQITTLPTAIQQARQSLRVMA